MKIIIPMSGRGRRFQRAGYTLPKPLIPVEGRPIIQHVVERFAPDDTFIFICNREQLDQFPLETTLCTIAPGCEIISIEPHHLGPVHAVLQVKELLRPDEPYVVNYCDFSWRWDYAHFRRTMAQVACDGSVVTYTGFHPSLLNGNRYAGVRAQGDQWAAEIREKHSFTTDPMASHHSTGTYYFRRGEFLLQCFEQLVEAQAHVLGEYYVSSAMQQLIERQHRVACYEVPYFLQWGTPEDLEEYQYWSRYFRRSPDARPVAVMDAEIPQRTHLVPLAGEGQRFRDAGYVPPKPLVPVAGEPMILAAAKSLGPATQWVFVCRREHCDQHPLAEQLRRAHPDCAIIMVDATTAGQASTCYLAEGHLPDERPLLIGACDHGLVWDAARFAALCADPSVDAVIWTFRNHRAVQRHPHMYGWVHTDADGRATGISCKRPISETPMRDHAIVGTFYFRRADLFKAAYRDLIAGERRIHNEWYLDMLMQTLIEQGRRVQVFEVETYLCWGTPTDLQVYEYWARFFRLARAGSQNGDRPENRPI